MGLLYTKHLSLSTVLVWNIEESLPELLNLADLTHDESVIYEQFTSEKKKRQWLTTRAMINQYYGSKTIISYLSSGQPFLVHSPSCISISHSEELVAVAINPTSKIGIDIQKFSKSNLQKATDFFLNETDLLLLDNYNTTILYTLWSLKEAAFKYIGNPALTLKTHFSILQIEPFTPNQPAEALLQVQDTSQKNKTLHLHYHLYPNYVLAYTNCS